MRMFAFGSKENKIVLDFDMYHCHFTPKPVFLRYFINVSKLHSYANK